MASLQNKVIDMGEYQSEKYFGHSNPYQDSYQDLYQYNNMDHTNASELAWANSKYKYYEKQDGNTPSNGEVQEDMDAEKLFDILREDRNESEKRMQKQMQMLEDRIVRQSEKTEERIMQAVSEIKHDIADAKKETQEAKSWIIGIALATILGIAAMVITIILAR